ncbi:MAG: hypothetical protein KGZ39_06785 [Simkania sp.]|nr:hypothetical protein [Simkania sp.]
MQLFALRENERISARQALKQYDYRCLECLNPVRVRSGPHRQPHFFHTTSHPLCTQQGKTLFHLQTQERILQTLPQGDVELEVPFPNIGRIADAVWESKQLIFEVQCSSISEQEARKRIHDYETLGYRVIWILHEKRFNRRQLSAAEQFLVNRECYFSSIDIEGGGMIYDQFAIVRNNKRLFRGPRLEISLAHPFSLCQLPLNDQFPKELLQRASMRHIGFRGDLFDRLHATEPQDWFAMKRLEQHFNEKQGSCQSIKSGLSWIKHVYLSLLHAFLEKHSA